MTLLSLASKQIWPHVLTVAHLKPTKLLLLHSEDPVESMGPSQRLKRLFDETGLVAKGGTRLEPISGHDFSAIERQLDALPAKHQLNLNDCLLNFTGGNKIMATAAFRWAVKRGVQAFYLERRNQLTWFEPRDGEVLTRNEPLPASLTDHLDALALLRCQSDASEIERPGEQLRLNSSGQKTPLTEFDSLHQTGNDLRRFLEIQGQAGRDAKEGDPLEYNTAAMLLKLGVVSVQRSLRLKVKSALQVSTRNPHAEIDLLFNHGGRLWLVDCKDRKSSGDLVDGLEREVRPVLAQLRPETSALFQRIRQELSISQTKALKEDLIAVRETGGLLGQVICVRREALPEEVLQYARRNQIEVVSKSDLANRLRALLQPDATAAQTDLQSLADAFAKK